MSETNFDKKFPKPEGSDVHIHAESTWREDKKEGYIEALKWITEYTDSEGALLDVVELVKIIEQELQSLTEE